MIYQSFVVNNFFSDKSVKLLYQWSYCKNYKCMRWKHHVLASKNDVSNRHCQIPDASFTKLRHFFAMQSRQSWRLPDRTAGLHILPQIMQLLVVHFTASMFCRHTRFLVQLLGITVHRQLEYNILIIHKFSQQTYLEF